jgi:hypothetical protein
MIINITIPMAKYLISVFILLYYINISPIVTPHTPCPFTCRAFNRLLKILSGFPVPFLVVCPIIHNRRFKGIKLSIYNIYHPIIYRGSIGRIRLYAHTIPVRVIFVAREAEWSRHQFMLEPLQ